MAGRQRQWTGTEEETLPACVDYCHSNDMAIDSSLVVLMNDLGFNRSWSSMRKELRQLVVMYHTVGPSTIKPVQTEGIINFIRMPQATRDSVQSTFGTIRSPAAPPQTTGGSAEPAAADGHVDMEDAHAGFGIYTQEALATVSDLSYMWSATC
jgi:hypothetical protein